MDLVLVLAISIFIIVLLSVADLWLGLRSMTRLSRVPPAPEAAEPMVSVVVPACNEEANIESAILALLRQDYRNLEIIAVNDRSGDGTAAILENLRRRHPETLRVFHLVELPRGWMGKSHALQFGAGQARGEYLLFTDADSHLEKSTVSRAVGHMQRERLDHITLVFRNSSPGLLLNSLILEAGTGLLQCFRPWRARSSSSSAFIGIGAFNLVRRSAFEGVGGFAAIKMHPVDDMMLGRILKRHGFRQECLIGYDSVTVPWYESVGQMTAGLMKNVLAVIHYRFFLVPPLLAILFLFYIFPLWGTVLSCGAARLLFAGVVLARLASSYAGTRLLGLSPWCVPGTLISPYIMFYIFLKATWRNGRDDGIYWRGTHYSLAELRKNEKLLF